ncbi:MAG: hypothetical protein KDC06_08840 [Chitinophagaceae bacterium]|nr:hypothetical protein [Chitinophagaceae bacterium]
MKKLQFFILFTMIAGMLHAQNTYMLYSYKGNVSVVDNNTTTAAKLGKTLSANAIVKLGNGASVTLLCNQAAMFSFSKAGSYKLSSYTDLCKPGKNSVSANYVKYVWAQMTKDHGSPGSNRKAYMNTVGAVSRSINNIWVDPRLDTVNYSTGAFPLSWKSYASADNFDFKLFSSDNLTTPIFQKEVHKKKIPIKDFTSAMKPGNTYYWSAAIKGENNEELKVLHYYSDDDFQKFEKKLKAQGPESETEAQQAYRLAFMLEDAHFLSEAFKYYQKADELDKDNVLYRNTLMSFRKDYELK